MRVHFSLRVPEGSRNGVSSSTPDALPPSGFLTLLTVCSSHPLAGLFHPTSAPGVLLGPSCPLPRCSAEALHLLPVPAPEATGAAREHLQALADAPDVSIGTRRSALEPPTDSAATVPPPLGRPEGLPGGCCLPPLRAGGSGCWESHSGKAGSALSVHAKRNRNVQLALDSRYRASPDKPALRDCSGVSAWAASLRRPTQPCQWVGATQAPQPYSLTEHTRCDLSEEISRVRSIPVRPKPSRARCQSS
jgi:hypothetical protein